MRGRQGKAGIGRDDGGSEARGVFKKRKGGR